MWRTIWPTACCPASAILRCSRQLHQSIWKRTLDCMRWRELFCCWPWSTSVTPGSSLSRWSVSAAEPTNRPVFRYGSNYEKFAGNICLPLRHGTRTLRDAVGTSHLCHERKSSRPSRPLIAQLNDFVGVPSNLNGNSFKNHDSRYASRSVGPTRNVLRRARGEEPVILSRRRVASTVRRGPERLGWYLGRGSGLRASNHLREFGGEACV